MPVILGIDPGTRVVGWAVVESDGRKFRSLDFGAVDVRKELTFGDRLRVIYRSLAEVIDRHEPGEAVFEKVFAGKNMASAIRMGEGRGVAMVCAANHGLEIHEYSAKEIKKAVTGRGDAHKSQVQEMVRLLLGLSTIPTPDDAADACAIAICRANRWGYGSGG